MSCLGIPTAPRPPGPLCRRHPRWDITFWAERLRESKYNISDEELRPYFALPTVLQGLWQVRV